VSAAKPVPDRAAAATGEHCREPHSARRSTSSCGQVGQQSWPGVRHNPSAVTVIFSRVLVACTRKCLTAGIHLVFKQTQTSPGQGHLSATRASTHRPAHDEPGGELSRVTARVAPVVTTGHRKVETNPASGHIVREWSQDARRRRSGEGPASAECSMGCWAAFTRVRARCWSCAARRESARPL
jgi:hypothetical protein